MGWAAGAIACALGFAWLIAPMRVEGGLPSPAALALYALFVALQALRFAAHAGLALALRRHAGRGPSTAFALAFVLSERFAPALIPWSFSAALVDLPASLALAPWLGPVGASLGAVACNALFLELALSARRRQQPAPADRASPPSSPPARRAPNRPLAWLALLALLASFDRLALAHDGARGTPPLRVGVVQAPSVARERDASFAWRRLLSLHRDATSRGATLVAMGEGTLPFEPDAGALAAGEARFYADAFVVPTLVGAVVRLAADRRSAEAGAPAAKDEPAFANHAPATKDEPAFANSVLAFDRDGLAGRYDKATLLPFSEYLPFEASLPWLRDLSPASGRFRPGVGPSPLRIAGRTLAPSICFEDLFSASAREVASAPGVELLFNATNDGWFGDTAEPWVHLAHSRLRAAESARPLIRAATTGPSALIDARGRVVALADPFRDAVLVAELRPASGPASPYARWGDVAWITALAALALVRRAPPARAGAHLY